MSTSSQCVLLCAVMPIELLMKNAMMEIITIQMVALTLAKKMQAIHVLKMFQVCQFVVLHAEMV